MQKEAGGKRSRWLFAGGIAMRELKKKTYKVIANAVTL
jgi:hypothetical protein